VIRVDPITAIGYPQFQPVFAADIHIYRTGWTRRVDKTAIEYLDSIGKNLEDDTAIGSRFVICAEVGPKCRTLPTNRINDPRIRVYA
jgi:hypothetical protein